MKPDSFKVIDTNIQDWLQTFIEIKLTDSTISKTSNLILLLTFLFKATLITN